MFFVVIVNVRIFDAVVLIPLHSMWDERDKIFFVPICVINSFI